MSTCKTREFFHPYQKAKHENQTPDQKDAEIARLRTELDAAQNDLMTKNATIKELQSVLRSATLETLKVISERDAALDKSDRLRDAYEGVRALNLQINDENVTFPILRAAINTLRTERDAALAEIGLLKEHVRCVINERELATDLLNTARAEIDVFKQALANESDWKKELYAQLSEARESLEGVRKDLAPIHYCDVVSEKCKICTAVLRIDEALYHLSSPGAQQFPSIRKLIDITWGYALQDGSVPSSKVQDKLIALLRLSSPGAQQRRLGD